MQKTIFLVPVLFLLLAVSAKAVEPTQQYNKIYLNPFYINSMTSGTNYTYIVDVNPPDHISSVISAIVSMEVWMTPSINFTILVNGKQCNTVSYYISTTYASAGSARVNFDCSNIITHGGNYSITIKPTLANTGSSTAWLELTYMNRPFGEMKMMGTEYQINDYATVFLQLKDSGGFSVNNGNCYLDVYYPNQPNLTHTLWLTNAPMVYLNNSDGIYYYDIGYLPNITGVYMLSATCSYTFSDLWVFGSGDTRKSNRTVIQGTYYGDTISLNAFEDGIYTECASGGGRTCEVYYDFNLSAINIAGCTIADLFYSGEVTAKPTTTFYVWNWTSGSWITLPNTLTFSGLATVSSPSGVNDFVSNSFLLNNTISNTSIMRIRLYTPHTATYIKYDNWLSLRFLIPSGSIQEIKGSGEIHITNHTVNINPEQVWNYPNRTLTDYNQSGILNFLSYINSTMNLQYSNLYNLMVSINASIANEINAINSTINANIFAINGSIYSQINAINVSINSKMDTINDNIISTNTSLTNLINSVNITINSNINSVNSNLNTINASIMELLYSINKSQGNFTSLENLIISVNGSINGNIDSAKTSIENLINSVNSTINSNILATNGTINANIFAINSTINGNIFAINQSLANQLYGITGKLQEIQDNITMVYNLVGASNATIMNKLYRIQDEITSVNDTVKSINQSIQSHLDSIDSTLNSIQGDLTQIKGNLTEVKATLQEINSTTYLISGKIDNLSLDLASINASLVSYIGTSLNALESNLTTLIISVNDTVISSNITIMNKLYGIQGELANMTETIVNNLLNITNITANITLSQQEVINTMVALYGNQAKNRNFAYLGVGITGLLTGGDNGAVLYCKDNMTLAQYSVQNVSGSINMTNVFEDLTQCTYGCVKNACVIPQYMIWLYVLIALILVFVVYLWFERQSWSEE